MRPRGCVLGLPVTRGPRCAAMKTRAAAAGLEPRRTYQYYDLLLGAFVTVLLCSDMIGASKVVTVGGFTFGAGILFFPLSYIFGDVLTEVYGYARSRRVVWAGFAAVAFASLMSAVVVRLPPAAAYKNQAALEAISATRRSWLRHLLVVTSPGEFVNLRFAKMKRSPGQAVVDGTIGSGDRRFAIFYPAPPRSVEPAWWCRSRWLLRAQGAWRRSTPVQGGCVPQAGGARGPTTGTRTSRRVETDAASGAGHGFQPSDRSGDRRRRQSRRWSRPPSPSTVRIWCSSTSRDVLERAFGTENAWRRSDRPICSTCADRWHGGRRSSASGESARVQPRRQLRIGRNDGRPGACSTSTPARCPRRPRRGAACAARRQVVAWVPCRCQCREDETPRRGDPLMTMAWNCAKNQLALPRPSSTRQRRWTPIPAGRAGRLANLFPLRGRPRDSWRRCR